MRVAIFDRVEPPVPSELPLRLTETCSRRSAMALLILTIPAVLAAMLASLMLILEALVIPGPRAILAQHPVLGLEILTGIAFWAYLAWTAPEALWSTDWPRPAPS